MTTKQYAKLFIYRTAKLFGLFSLSRALTRGELRILCYHGTWNGISGNNCFGNILFIQPELFAHRMRLIKKLGYPVVSLEDGLSMLESGTNRSGEVVITIDDGWYSTYEKMLPALEENKFDATVYVATYYVTKEQPVTRLLNRYILRNTTKKVVQLNGITEGISGQRTLNSVDEREKVAEEFYQQSKFMDIDGEREACEKLAKVCDVDIQTVIDNRTLHLMTAQQILDMSHRGFDVQLHTHRHVEITEDNRHVLQKEVLDNRAVLQDILNKNDLVHFCYPSGYFTSESAAELKQVSVVSATTCLPGLNDASQNSMELFRITDSQVVSDIEFEAAMSGFRYLIPHLKKRFKSR